MNTSTKRLSRKHAQVQCSILSSAVHRHIGVQVDLDRIPSSTSYSVDHSNRRRRRDRSTESSDEIYEDWEVESLDDVRADSAFEQRIRDREHVDRYNSMTIDDDDDSQRIVYIRRPQHRAKQTYLPSNVRMMCIRQDTNRTSR
jgi:hypothetical protein